MIANKSKMKKSLQKTISPYFALLVFIIIVGIVPYNSNAQNTTPKQKPNFIFILIDDLGWTSSSQLMDGKIANSKSDYYETPQIEKLAAKGIRFSDFRVAMHHVQYVAQLEGVFNLDKPQHAKEIFNFLKNIIQQKIMSVPYHNY